jgi:hypothetical protein
MVCDAISSIIGCRAAASELRNAKVSAHGLPRHSVSSYGWCAREYILNTLLRRIYKIAKRDYYRLHVRLSVRFEQLDSPQDGFWWNLVFRLSSKINRENSSFVKVRQEYQVCYMKTISCYVLLRMRNVLNKVVQKITTHFISSKFMLFTKWCKRISWIWRGHNLSLYSAYEFQAGKARLHANACMYMHARTHKQTCTIYCFSTATIIPEHNSILRYAYIVCFVDIYIKVSDTSCSSLLLTEGKTISLKRKTSRLLSYRMYGLWSRFSWVAISTSALWLSLLLLVLNDSAPWGWLKRLLDFDAVIQVKKKKIYFKFNIATFETYNYSKFLRQNVIQTCKFHTWD